jgi:hypothetical protein
MPPVYLFVIDVSAAAYACGMVSVVASTIKSCLDELPGDERTLVGFITYDASLHFYNLKANLAAPQVGGGTQQVLRGWYGRAMRPRSASLEQPAAVSRSSVRGSRSGLGANIVDGRGLRKGVDDVPPEVHQHLREVAGGTCGWRCWHTAPP